MRNPLLLAAAISLITGCKTAPPSSTVSADQLIDEQIAVSASTLSQAQLRLHQTAAPAPGAPPAVAGTTVPAAAPVKLAVPVVVMPAPAPAPKIVEVVQAHNGPSPAAQAVADALKPSALSKAGSTSAVPLAKPVSTTLAVKSIASTPVPPVVLAKATPLKPVAEQWTMSTSDVTLRRALGKWAAKAGWQLVWEASVDVPINVTATFEGDFRTAVKRLFQSLSAADVNLTGMLYAGNRVLRVTESGRRAQ
jgi:hypothetical protein